MISRLIQISKHLDRVHYDAKRAKERGYGPQACELERKLMADATDHVQRQLDKAIEDLEIIKGMYR